MLTVRQSLNRAAVAKINYYAAKGTEIKGKDESISFDIVWRVTYVLGTMLILYLERLVQTGAFFVPLVNASRPSFFLYCVVEMLASTVHYSYPLSADMDIVVQ